MTSSHQEDSDDEWEDIHIVLDIKEFENTNLLSSVNTYSIIGLDTLRPIVKLGNFVFEGTFDQYMGTALLFEHLPTPPHNSSHSEHTKLQYSLKTKRVLRLNRILIKPQQLLAASTTTSDETTTTTTNTTIDLVNNEPMDISND